MGFRIGLIKSGMALGVLVALTAATQANLLRNGSFETEATSAVFTEARYWKMGDPDVHGDYWGSASRESWRAYDGSYIGSVRGLWAGLGSHGGVWQEVEAEVGATYRFSGWFFCDPEWVAKIQEIKIEFWDENYEHRIDVASKSINKCDEDWTETAVAALAPEGTVWVRVVVNVLNSGASGSLQFDYLVLEKVAP